MAHFVLIHGAGTNAWYWGPLTAELRSRGHDVVAPEMPVTDESAGLSEYADAVIEHIDRSTRPVVVAHSFAGFIGPIVCDRIDTSLLVMLHAQIPIPGETPGEWWVDSGYQEARVAHDAEPGVPSPADVRAFALHDSPRDLVEEYLAAHTRDQSARPFEDPWPLSAWPSVPTRVLNARDDHFFPAAFLRELAQERLGIEADEVPGDHSPMLGNPEVVAERLEAYLREIETP